MVEERSPHSIALVQKVVALDDQQSMRLRLFEELRQRLRLLTLVALKRYRLKSSRWRRRPLAQVDDDRLTRPAVASTVKAATERTLGRSSAIRHVDAGSCNACELEIHVLSNAFYDLERFGFRFVTSPRHADVLLVTGPVTLNMREALKRTYDATPAPKWVVASGACAADGGVLAGS